jgi:hypothetical protein
VSLGRDQKLSDPFMSPFGIIGCSQITSTFVQVAVDGDPRMAETRHCLASAGNLISDQNSLVRIKCDVADVAQVQPREVGVRVHRGMQQRGSCGAQDVGCACPGSGLESNRQTKILGRFPGRPSATQAQQN